MDLALSFQWLASQFAAVATAGHWNGKIWCFGGRTLGDAMRMQWAQSVS